MATASGGKLKYGLYAYVEYSVSSTATTTTLSVTKAQARTSTSSVGVDGRLGTFSGTGQTSKTNASWKMRNSATVNVHSAFTWSWARGTSASSKTIKFQIKHDEDSHISTASFTVSVPALASYSVSYNANGGSGAPGAQTKYYGVTLTLSSTKPTKSGYTFLGWSTSSTATSASYASGGSYTGNASLYLYAIWRKTITVSYNANGGSGAPGAQTAYAYNSATSASITLSGTVPTRTGYTTDGWATSESGAKTYNRSTAYTFSSSTTLYAHWNTVTYSLSYNLAGGTIASENPSSYNIETDTFILNEPTRLYYRFLGWTGSNGSTPQKNLSIAKGSTGNRSYTANWERTYIAPTLSIVDCKRDNISHSGDDSGTVPHIKFEWTSGTDEEVVGEVEAVTPTAYSITFTNQDNPSEVYSFANQPISASPVNVYCDTITLTAESTYDVEVTLHLDGYDDITGTDYISQAYFIMDVNADGTAIGFGTPVDDTDSGIHSLMKVNVYNDIVLHMDENAEVGDVGRDLYDALDELGWI